MTLLRRGSTGRRFVVFLAIAVLSALAGLMLYRETFSFVQQVDLRFKDARFALCRAAPPAVPVTIIAIDNRSIKELGRWPWSRELTARLISSAAKQGARVIALDMVFSEPQGKTPDGALAAAIASAGNVVMGYFFRADLQTDDRQALIQLAESKVSFLRVASGATTASLPAYDYVDANIAAVGGAAAGFGFFNQLADADGLYRSMPLLMLFRGEVYPALSLAAVSCYLGEPLRVGIEQFGISSISFASCMIPAGERGGISIAYYGPGGTVHTVSAADVIAERLPIGTLSDRLVFVGVTETGIADLRATPLDPDMPGVEMHATFAANALEGKFLTRNSLTLGIEMGTIALLPLLLALALATVPSTLRGLAVFILITSGYLGINFHLFSALALDLSIVYPLLPLVFTYLGGEAYRNLVVERKGRYLKKAFSSYVSPELVDEIVKNPGRLQLGGEKREISILFSDIRGFTSLSETLAPEELVKLLNDYLSPMTRIVMDERGTLDKFIGDAIMAIFNAPLDLPGHPACACRAAVRMVERLRELNDVFAGRGLPQIDIGIGVNTGEAVVGNMGADTRFDYTAIGDSVNLASRLEGLNKLYGTRIIVSEATRDQTADGSFIFREVDLVRVKGKSRPVAVYEIMVDHGEIAPIFEKGLALYRKSEFKDAALEFEMLAENSGDLLSQLYLKRCREYLVNLPPAEWDGVYVAMTK